MRYSKKTLALGVMAAAAMLVAAGCAPGGDGGGSSSPGGDEAFVVGYSGAVQADPNNKAVEDGMRAKVEELGGEFIVTDANLDPSKQYSDVQSLINKKIDVLVIWPMDPLSIQPAIQEADAAGIPVIVQDTTDGGPYASNFQVGNFESAKEAAQLIEDTVGPNAKVVSIEGIPSVGVLDARNRGFAEGAAALGQTVLASQVNETNNADGARPIIDAWKSRFGSEIQAVFAYNDLSALGAASAVTDKFNPVIIGMNGEAEAVAAVKDGRLLATYNMHPVELGAGLGWGAIELAKGGTLPEKVEYSLTLVTADNADEWIPVDELLTKKIDVKIVEENGTAKLETTVS